MDVDDRQPECAKDGTVYLKKNMNKNLQNIKKKTRTNKNNQKLEYNPSLGSSHFGFCFSIYFGAITFTGDVDYWDGQPWVTMTMGTVVLGIVFWTGIIKWQLPRIKKWNRNRKKSKVATN